MNLAVRAVEAAATDTDQSEHSLVDGRVLEAKGTDSNGGRVFRVRVIAFGDSKNGRNYPEAVMREAVGLYAGSKVFDRHRSTEDLRSSTVAGLTGWLDAVEAGSAGIDADLHLLPSSTHAAEALDATIAAQNAGLPPLLGLSHDVMGVFKPVTRGGRRMQEATQITRVHSVDLVADPAAGGIAQRAVAGGIDDDVPGLDEPYETSHDKSTARGKGIIVAEATARGLQPAIADQLGNMLPARFTENELTTAITSLLTILGQAERAGLAPKAAPGEGVAVESLDKKRDAIDRMFEPGFKTGPCYRSLREAWMDWSGARPDFLGEDMNRRVLAESMGTGFRSSQRASESLNTSSWAEVLGDSVTRRLVSEYARPDLMIWQQIVSSVATGLDFRTQRRGRVGGYGVLPAVNQGQPYQPLTSPGDEEATYAVSKRGGTEDLTLEMIANDDVQAIRSIPLRLGRSAAQTLYRFVFDMLANNATCSYDSTALFHANHANTDNPAVLSMSALSAGRKKMRKQSAYGDTSDILSIVPKYLLVPSDLEEIAWQLCVSTVALPSGAPTGAASDIPNIHMGMRPMVIDYWSDTNDWYAIADPTMCPTIELGFYSANTEPELFTQADPTNGSMFNADAMQFKIRHVYSGTVLEHRGMYRGAN